MLLDRKWFEKNPNTNMRLRRPGPGEVEELAKQMHQGVGYELAMSGGVFPPPSPAVEWWVMVISAGDAIIRMLVIRDKGAVLRPDAQMAVYAMAAGNRVAIDVRKP